MYNGSYRRPLVIVKLQHPTLPKSQESLERLDMLNHHVRNPRSVGTTVSLTPEQMKLLSNVGIKGKNRLNLLNAKATQRILE